MRISRETAFLFEKKSGFSISQHNFSALSWPLAFNLSKKEGPHIFPRALHWIPRSKASREGQKQ